MSSLWRRHRGQLIDPKHPHPLTVEKLDVRSVKMTIDYNPQTNEYLLEKQRELKAELETLDPDSDRAHRITACYLRDVEDKLAQTHLHYEPECLIVDFGSFRIVTVPCEIDTVLANGSANTMANRRFCARMPTAFITMPSTSRNMGLCLNRSTRISHTAQPTRWSI